MIRPMACMVCGQPVAIAPPLFPGMDAAVGVFALRHERDDQ